MPFVPILALIPLLTGVALAVACLSWGLSWWSMSIACAFTTLASAMFTRNARTAWIALALFVGPFLLHAGLSRSATRLTLPVLPGARAMRLLNTLVPERDGALFAAGMLQQLEPLDDEEAPRFVSILQAAYARIDGALPTPAVATYLGMQSPDAFDTLVIPPAGTEPAQKAVISLHGYAGNFHVYCWEFAQAARAAGMLTLCPSTGSRGAWWDDAGDRIFRATLAYAHALGARSVVLAGLSNGAAGASVIARRHARALSGLVLVSGVSQVEPSGLPTLLIQGSRDRMMPPSAARAYAKQSARVRYRELAGGHLLFLSQSARVRPMISEFLRAR